MAKQVKNPEFLQKTDKGVFIRQNFADSLISSVARYAYDVNRVCMPMLRELGMATSVPSILRYCSRGGKERLHREYMDAFPEGSAFKRVAESQFNYVIEKYAKSSPDRPRFREIANSWKYAHLIRLDDEGLLAVDIEACEDRQKVFVSTPEGITFVENLKKLVNVLNETIPTQSGYPMQTIKDVICYDGIARKFIINSSILCNNYIKRINEKQVSQWEQFRQNQIEGNKVQAAVREQLKAELAEQGVTAEEFAAIVEADRDLQDFTLD